jgi:hypothetical protein
MKTDKSLQFLDFDAEYYPVPKVPEEWLCPWCLKKLNNFFDNCCLEKPEKE